MSHNNTTATWPGLETVRPAIDRPIAMRLAQLEYQRVADAVDTLRAEDWTRGPTARRGTSATWSPTSRA